MSREALVEDREEQWERHRGRKGAALAGEAVGITGRDPGKQAGSTEGYQHQEGNRQRANPPGRIQWAWRSPILWALLGI